MAAYRLCSSFWKRANFNVLNPGFKNQIIRSVSNNAEQIKSPSTPWKFLVLAFGLPVSGFLFYKTIIEPENAGLSEEEKSQPYITRLMVKYLMEDPLENKRKIHEHIKACREVADKRLYLNNTKQNEITPGKFREALSQEKKNVDYDTAMY